MLEAKTTHKHKQGVVYIFFLVEIRGIEPLTS